VREFTREEYMLLAHEVAMLIREGLRHDVRETSIVVLSKSRENDMGVSVFYACALGFALVGKYKNPQIAMFALAEQADKLGWKGQINGPSAYLYLVAVLLNTSLELVESIDAYHIDGLPASKIADRLLLEGDNVAVRIKATSS
jgi:hypothetical protein